MPQPQTHTLKQKQKQIIKSSIFPLLFLFHTHIAWESVAQFSPLFPCCPIFRVRQLRSTIFFGFYPKNTENKNHFNHFPWRLQFHLIPIQLARFFTTFSMCFDRENLNGVALLYRLQQQETLFVCFGHTIYCFFGFHLTEKKRLDSTILLNSVWANALKWSHANRFSYFIYFFHFVFDNYSVCLDR